MPTINNMSHIMLSLNVYKHQPLRKRNSLLGWVRLTMRIFVVESLVMYKRPSYASIIFLQRKIIDSMKNIILDIFIRILLSIYL